MPQRSLPGRLMRSRFRNILIVLYISIFCFISLSQASTPPVPERPPDYVVDLAGIIENNIEMRMNSILRELETKTGTQMVILTITSLDGESIEEFSINTAEQWKLGQKGVDNGVLVTVAVKDRKYRFEIGYGLEGTLPDSFVGSVGRKYLVPYFKKGNYSLGLYYATMAIIDKIAKEEGITIGETERNSPLYTRAVKTKKIGIVEILFGALFFIVAMILFIRHPALFMLLLFSSGGRGWRGGGGFGGGGFGGFGGGGGGGFGGGGASGGW